MAFIQLAKGAGRWFFATQTAFAILQLSLVLLLVPRHGLVGAAYAFALSYGLYTPAMLWVGSRLIGFVWSHEVQALLMVSAFLVAAAFLARVLFDGWIAISAGSALAFVGGLYSLRWLAERLGSNHRLIRLAIQIPGLQHFMPKRIV